MIPTKEMKKLRAFHNKPELKKAMVSELNWHKKQDKIIQGTYGTEYENGDFKGCAVGCSIHSLNRKFGKHLKTDDHKMYETELGIPETLAYLEDRIFEGLSVAESKDFPINFIKAIPVGANLSLIPAKFIVFVLEDTLKTKEVKEDDAVYKAVRDVADLWQKVVEGKMVKPAAWSAARSAAWSAAWSAAYTKYAKKLISLLKSA